jgi:hypothetical protein
MSRRREATKKIKLNELSWQMNEKFCGMQIRQLAGKVKTVYTEKLFVCYNWDRLMETPRRVYV